MLTAQASLKTHICGTLLSNKEITGETQHLLESACVARATITSNKSPA